MNNKVILVAMPIVFVAAFGLVLFSEGKDFLSIQSTPQKTINTPQILLQLQLRNSDGHIVSYIEGTKIVFIKPDKLNQFLDTLPDKKTIIKNGKKFELFQWIGPSEKYTKFHSWSGYELRVLPINGKYQTVLMILHNAYQTQPGDTATVRWTVLRPII